MQKDKNTQFTSD